MKKLLIYLGAQGIFWKTAGEAVTREVMAYLCVEHVLRLTNTHTLSHKYSGTM